MYDTCPVFRSIGIGWQRGKGRARQDRKRGEGSERDGGTARMFQVIIFNVVISVPWF